MGKPKEVAVKELNRLKGKTLMQIFSQWALELDAETVEFHQQAKRLMDQDVQLIQDGKRIHDLYEEVLKLEMTAKETDEALDYAEGLQRDTSEALESYTSQVQAIVSSHPKEQGQTLADQERERALDLARGTNGQLDEMRRSLMSLAEEVNDLSSLQHEGLAQGPMEQLIEILDAQLTTLQWVEREGQELEAKVAQAEQEYQRVVGGVRGNGMGRRGF